MSILSIDFIADKIKGKSPLIVNFISIVENIDDILVVTFGDNENIIENNSSDIIIF